LKYLKDVRIIYLEDGISFTIEFTFDENLYFSNTSLTKLYTYDLIDHGLSKTECSAIQWKSDEMKTNTVIKTKKKEKREII